MSLRKIFNIMLCTIVISMLIQTVSFAANFNPLDYTAITVESNLLSPEIKESRDYVRNVTRRGVFFAAADLIITNDNGDIDVGAHAYMSEPVDEIYITIYLDRQYIDDNGDEKWENIDSFEFEFYAEDYPDGELTSESVEFTLTGYPKNKYYRLRGAYAAVKDGVLEGFGPVTEGVLIY